MPPPLMPPPLGPPRPPRSPLAAPPSFLPLFFGFGVSSINRVSSGKLSGKIKYRIVLPRTVIVSRLIVSPGSPGFALRDFVVILTARSAVFICGETEVMVPWTIVPFLSSIVTVSLAHFIRNLVEVKCQSSSAREGCADRGSETVSLQGVWRCAYLTSFMVD